MQADSQAYLSGIIFLILHSEYFYAILSTSLQSYTQYLLAQKICNLILNINVTIIDLT